MNDFFELKVNKVAIRKLAQKLLDECKLDAAPIMIRDVVRHLKDNSDFEIAALDLGNTSGVQITDQGKAFIGYNKNQPKHRQRFSVAHEIGHLILGHTRGNQDHKFMDKSKVAEKEADCFAAELLMPYKMVKTDISDNPSLDAKDLALKYDVSDEAMWVRISECGFLSKLGNK